MLNAQIFTEAEYVSGLCLLPKAETAVGVVEQRIEEFAGSIKLFHYLYRDIQDRIPMVIRVADAHHFALGIANRSVAVHRISGLQLGGTMR